MSKRFSNGQLRQTQNKNKCFSKKISFFYKLTRSKKNCKNLVSTRKFRDHKKKKYSMECHSGIPTFSYNLNKELKKIYVINFLLDFIFEYFSGKIMTKTHILLTRCFGLFFFVWKNHNSNTLIIKIFRLYSYEFKLSEILTHSKNSRINKMKFINYLII